MFANFVRNAVRSQAVRQTAARTFSTGSRASAAASVSAQSVRPFLLASTLALGGVGVYMYNEDKIGSSTVVEQLTTGLFAQQVHASPLPPHGIPGTKHERTFICVKPDGVQRQLVGEVVRRFEARGLKLVAMKMEHPTKAKAAGHYNDLRKKPFFASLCDYFSSGPVVALVFEGRDAIATGRSLVGATDPQSSKPGSLRGDYCIHISRNIIHGSDSKDAAKHEINFWFSPSELNDYELCNANWVSE
mmetsp:Transcript_18435/g.46892  ORF Transcript_18435/g.46892 Transcript_18435/m.46892 type:complete len:246 (-) Transcript_18435:38-775(-)|eukprot:CAMPEP_0177646156 /NCGR_PEP_ID=MMETSP0447-20121125/9625_1 /TAXON_ID=0 /ORGANISM="Stygamoeba regulata, Strain BSH-02190019" /LENGTH=245 /DNA_ID=CAMNT_0019148673 /DNA_START=45 /DNA_END=782 /DNA_ORIENTATION=-